MLEVRFRAILRLQHFSRARPYSLICRCSREHSFLNFREQSLPKLFIWPNDTSSAISRNSDTPTLFARAHALVNLQLLLGALLFECSRANASKIILFIWPNDTTRVISCNSESLAFFARALVLFNLPMLPEAHLFKFSRAIASNIIYLA